MGKKWTLTYKILKEHLMQGELVSGNKIGIRMDQTLTQDATGTMAYLQFEAMGKGRVQTELSVSYVDHNMSQNGPENFNDHRYLQTVAAKIGAYFSRAGNGICHQVHLERFGAPGKTLIGSDSHTPTGGGIGMIAIGAGGLDVAMSMAGEAFFLQAPKVVGICLSGKLSPWVAAKDIILKVLSHLTTKGNVGWVAEYFGPGVESLSVPDRATVTNMGAELGVTTSLFPSDKRTREFLKAQGREAVYRPLKADTGAVYDRVIEIDLSTLEPMAACPSSPDQVRCVRECLGTKVHQVLLGSCTNSSLRDLTMVAMALAGRTVHKDVSLAIAPGSRQVLSMLSKSGMLTHFVAAGARILECGCGPCIGQGQSPGNGHVSLRTFNRNFKGRTGTPDDQVYLVSPETALMAALAGEIVDPRDFAAKSGIEYPAVKLPKKFLLDDTMILPPPGIEEAERVAIERGPTIGPPPKNTVCPKDIVGRVLIRVEDKVTTDHIMPAGAWLKYRSNIPEYSKVVFNAFNREGKPSFHDRALVAKKEGIVGVIVAGESYGQGSSREHAALCPMYLGVRLVLAKSIERIHADNLVNFGIVPLRFKSDADYQAIEEGQPVQLDNLIEQLSAGPEVVVQVGGRAITVTHTLDKNEVATVAAGGKLNRQ